VLNQFTFSLRRSYRSWLTYIGALFIIQVALAAVFNQAGAGLPGGMGQLIDLLPDAVRGFVGSSELDLLTPNGMLAVAYNHPLTKLMLSVFAVGLAANAIAGELQKGTLDLVLARPIRRYRLLLGSGLTLLVVACALGGVMLLGTFIGAQMSDIAAEVQWESFGFLALNAIALVLAMSGLAFLCSALSKSGSQAVGWAGGVVAGMFFLNWFATLWDRVAVFSPLSLFYYYQPDDIINGISSNWPLNIIVLLSFAVVTFAAAAAVFERRDLVR
jgi:ABC-2 type transport system permease protein